MKTRIEQANNPQNIFPGITEGFLRNKYRNEILSRKISGGYFEDDLEIEAKINKSINGELSFLDSVSKHSLLAKKENPDRRVVVLFDLDETIVYNDWLSGNEVVPVIRPGFEALAIFLKAHDISLGIFSSRKEIESQLYQEGEIGQIGKHIDLNYVFSTRNTLPFGRDIELQKKYKDENFSNGDFEKIAFLEKVVSESPQDLYIPVDDLQYPKLFPYGVALKNDEKFFA